MLFLLETMDVIAVLLMLFMLLEILKQQSSKAQTAFLLYDVFTPIPSADSGSLCGALFRQYDGAEKENFIC